MRRKVLRLTIDEETWAWLLLIAQQTDQAPAGKHTVPQLLAQAALCMADAAGRRPGSWEAEVGRNLLQRSGLIQ